MALWQQYSTKLLANLPKSRLEDRIAQDQRTMAPQKPDCQILCFGHPCFPINEPARVTLDFEPLLPKSAHLMLRHSLVENEGGQKHVLAFKTTT